MSSHAQLPRRRVVGLALEPSPNGLNVVAAAEGLPAAIAGVQAGDVIRCVSGQEIRTVEEFEAALGRAPPIVLEVRREGAGLEVDLEPAELTREPDAAYGEVVVAGHRLRTVVTRAPGDSAPAVLMLQGIDVGSCEHPLHPAAPWRVLAHGLAAGGVTTLRIERRGIGDSEGPPPQQARWSDAQKEAAAGLGLLRADARVSDSYIFGHSVGALIAADLADADVAGIVSYGAPACRWVEAMMTAIRQQAPDLEVARLEREEALLVHVLREGGEPPADSPRDPITAEHLRSRDPEFLRALDALDPVRLWHAAPPLLALQGTADVAVGPGDAQRIADLAGPDATFAMIPDADHAMTHSAEQIAERVADWIHALERAHVGR